MKFWGKKHSEELLHHGVSAAAAADAPREEWIREAIHRLAALVEADRLGIWLEAGGSSQDSSSGVFRGAVWDRDKSETPPEWRQLSTEAPLPPAVLAASGSAFVELGASPQGAFFGPLLELRRALWVPVQAQGHLRGVILAGSKGGTPMFPAQPIESVAAELALALERDQQQRRANAYHADLEVTRALLLALSTGASPDAVLNRIVESCIEIAPSGELQPGLFAAIGVCEPAFAAAAAGLPFPKLSFPWSAGDTGTLAALHSGALYGMWRTAFETQRLVGTELRGVAAQGLAGRAVAIPLAASGTLLGVLVAVLPPPVASLSALGRLELRASLAAAALSRKQAQEQQSRQDGTQRAAVRSSQQPVLLLDCEGSILESSAAAQDLLACSPASSARPVSGEGGCPLSSFLGAPDRKRALAWPQRQFAANTGELAGAAETIEAELESGSRMRLHSLGLSAGPSMLLLLESLATHSSALSRDSVETELRSVIEWLEEGVVLFDAHENVRAINMRFEQMAGFSSQESGKYTSLAALIARLEGQAADPLAFAERWRSLARGMDGAVREELQMLHPAPRVLERSARPILDHVGRLLGRVEIYRDLTAQRVFQSKLLQTEKLAALGQMLTGVAHELSNPLTTILGYAQRLILRKDAAGQSEEARQIHQEAERASRILRQLLSHARETPPERRTLSLNQVVLRAMELRRFGLAAEKVNVEADLDPVLPPVRGDAGQLQQVLMNLLGNAQHALEQNGQGGTIRVRTRSEQGQVLLTVEDTGPGIPQAILARIFDPFFTTKPAGVGTGLGLSIALSIVREHGGQVRVASPPGKGAIFTVELPAVALRALHSTDPDMRGHLRRRSEAASLPSEAVAIGTGKSPAGAGAGKSILVVEDEPTVARFIADVLEDEGFRVQILFDGREALDRATRESFDLVICDMKMPGLDGQHFYKALKRQGHPLMSSFLFVTGDTMGPATQAFLAQNHLPFLSKPFRMEELTEHVWRTLHRPVGGAQTPVASRRSAARNG